MGRGWRTDEQVMDRIDVYIFVAGITGLVEETSTEGNMDSVWLDLEPSPPCMPPSIIMHAHPLDSSHR